MRPDSGTSYNEGQEMRRPLMLHPGIRRCIGLVLALLDVVPASGFGPGEAARGPRTGQTTKPLPSRADFAVLVWYRRDNPLETFQYQIYDVRTGEYTEVVDHWVREIRTKYPAYLVLVRPVDLSREAGQTEKLKVGSVIHRELLVAAAASGVVLGEPLNLSPGPSAGQGQAPRVNRPSSPFGGDRSYLNPRPPSFPVPLPYPRPHP